MCWLLRHYLNFLCEPNFIGQQIFNVSPWTWNCPNLYTHETHQPNLTYIQVVLNFMTSCEALLYIWRLCYNMLCKKRSAIIIINDKQTNLLLQNWLRPFLTKSTPGPLLFSKIVKTPAGVDSDSCTPLAVAPDRVLTYGKSKFALRYSNGKGMPSGFSHFYSFNSKKI